MPRFAAWALLLAAGPLAAGAPWGAFPRGGSVRRTGQKSLEDAEQRLAPLARFIYTEALRDWKDLQADAADIVRPTPSPGPSPKTAFPDPKSEP